MNADRGERVSSIMAEQLGRTKSGRERRYGTASAVEGGSLLRFAEEEVWVMIHLQV